MENFKAILILFLFSEKVRGREKTEEKAEREGKDRENEAGRNIFNKEGETRQSKSIADVGADESSRYKEAVIISDIISRLQCTLYTCI